MAKKRASKGTITNAGAELPASVSGVVAQPVLPAHDAPPALDRLGVVLRRARNNMGLTPRQCEDVLRIKEEYLLALENGYYNQLPTLTHAKGFLRTYANYLGLASELPSLQARFLIETQGVSQTPQLVMPAALPEAKSPTPKFIATGLVAAVLLALLFTWFSAPAPQPVAEPVVPAVPQQPAVAPAAVAPAAPVAAVSEPVEEVSQPKQEELALAAAPVSGVAIRAVDDVWVQVQDKTGATIFSRLLKKGEEVPAPAGDGLTLTAGNGAGIVLLLNGKATAPVGAKAEVVRGVSLDAKNIGARLNKPATKPKPKPIATIEAAPSADIEAAPSADIVTVPPAPATTVETPSEE